jgi:membrane-bound lytic murein transglycosylase D
MRNSATVSVGSVFLSVKNRLATSFGLVAACFILFAFTLTGCGGHTTNVKVVENPDALKSHVEKQDAKKTDEKSGQLAKTNEANADSIAVIDLSIPPAPVSRPAQALVQREIARPQTTEDRKKRAESSALKTVDPNDPMFGSKENSDDSEDPETAQAIDDEVWRNFDVAEDYHQMGVAANKQGSWREAQYYFEKSLELLAELDVETDSAQTPEAARYNTLLENVVSDYRVTLRSMGRLEGDEPASVLLDRFMDLESRLDGDSLLEIPKENGEITHDLPVVMNDRVRRSIVYFQTHAKEAFRKFLSRKPRYEWLYTRVLEEHSLPKDLVYLSMIESGFSPHAYSWARAMGLWQFIASTGKEYGLQRDWWVDERKDPIKATYAAARFLGDLNRKFDDWELAMAAYNGGPGRVSRTIAKQKTDDFWKLKLRQQTMDYVPLIYAASIISKDPARYGFEDIQYEAPIEWDEVVISKTLDLATVANALNVPAEQMKELNPELLRGVTPPNRAEYRLKVPKGFAAPFYASYESMAASSQGTWVNHTVRKGESLGSISSRYGISMYALLEANKMKKGAKLFAGKTIIVPVPHGRVSEPAPTKSEKSSTKYATNKSMYRVRSGDTMWDIAKAFGVSVEELRQANYLKAGSRIYVGQKIRIPRDGNPSSNETYASNTEQDEKPVSKGKAAPKKPTVASSTTSATSTYTVQSGDNLWEIARKFGMSATSLREMNGLGRSSTIMPGQKLKVSGSQQSGEFVVHRVERGDTISSIAAKYETTVNKILEANQLENPNQVRVGAKLKIYR